jgi:GNAT superfamily N-acetyltransferase
MAACNSELTVTADQIAERTTFVFEEQTRALAFYQIEVEAETADIALFFVDPSAIRRGIGTKMWLHLLNLCRRRGVIKITIASDPNAVEFFLSLGARQIGTAQSESVAGRSLPLLEYLLEHSA